MSDYADFLASKTQLGCLISNRTRARGVVLADGRWRSPFRLIIGVAVLGFRPERAGL